MTSPFTLDLRKQCHLSYFTGLKNIPDTKKKNGIWNEYIHLKTKFGTAACPITIKKIHIPLAISIEISRWLDILLCRVTREACTKTLTITKTMRRSRRLIVALRLVNRSLWLLVNVPAARLIAAELQIKGDGLKVKGQQLTANRRTKREQNQASLDYAEREGGKAYVVGLIANISQLRCYCAFQDPTPSRRIRYRYRASPSTA